MWQLACKYLCVLESWPISVIKDLKGCWGQCPFIHFNFLFFIIIGLQGDIDLRKDKHWAPRELKHINSACLLFCFSKLGLLPYLKVKKWYRMHEESLICNLICLLGYPETNFQYTRFLFLFTSLTLLCNSQTSLSPYILTLNSYAVKQNKIGFSNSEIF